MSQQKGLEITPGSQLDPSDHLSVNSSRLMNFGRNVLVLSGAVLAAGALAGASHAARHEGTGPKAVHSRSYETVPIVPQSAGFEASPDQIVTSVDTKHGAAIINGKPTFLFGVWAPKDDWAVNTLRANTLIANSSGDITQEQLAKSVEGRAWVLVDSQPDTPAFTKILPNEIGVSLRDEPDSPKTPLLPHEVAKSPSNGRLTFQNFTQHIGDGVVNNFKDPDPTTPGKKDYEAYISTLVQKGKPVVSLDIYVLNRESCKPNGLGIGSLYHYMQGEKSMVPVGTPIAGYVEAVRIDSDSCPIEMLPGEVTGSAKAEIAGGASMINWWTYSWLNPKNQPNPNSVNNDKVVEAIKDFTSQVHDLSPILLAQQMNERKLGLLSNWNDPIKIGGRIVANPDGSITNYIIAFNSSKQPVSTTQIKQKLPGLANQKVIEAVSGKILNSKDGKISDHTIPAEDWVILGYNLPDQMQTVNLKSGKVTINQSAAKGALQTIKRTEAAQKSRVKKAPIR